MQPTPHSRPLLFSIDLEEYYTADRTQNARSTPLPALVDHYLQLLGRHNVSATFFVVGEVARRFPGLLKTIVTSGHELACHGDRHHTIDQFTPETFALDLRANREAVETAAGTRVCGFRAPLLSLSARSSWAHAILAQEGFTYSSSVLPASNPLYGWKDFGASPRRVEGVLEIPVTVASVLPAVGALPLLCGTYFRILPWPLIRNRMAPLSAKGPLVSYFHPYDIDHHQPWTMHAGVGGSIVMNSLLFLRRRSLLVRIEKLLSSVSSTMTYSTYLAMHSATTNAE